MRPLLLACCTSTVLSIAFCVLPLLIASLCYSTQKSSHVELQASWLTPRRFASPHFKSGYAIPALTQQSKGAGGVAGQQSQQEVNSGFLLTAKMQEYKKQ